MHARSNGFSVDPETGDVVDTRPYDGLTETEADDRQAQCNEIVAWIEQALASAVSADEQLAAALDQAAGGLDVTGSDLSGAADAGASRVEDDLLPPPKAAPPLRTPGGTG